MVVRIPISPLLHGWTLRWHPCPRVGSPPSCCLQVASHTTWKDSLWTALPCLGVLGQRDYLPLRISRELEIIERCCMKKWWHWPWPSRGVLFVPEFPQGCSAGQCMSSTNASPQCLRVAINLTSRCWMWWRGTPWSPPLHRCLITDPQSRRTDQCTPQQANHFRARGGCATQGVGPGAKEKTTHLWADDSKPPPLEDVAGLWVYP